MSYGKVKRNRDIFGGEKKRKWNRFLKALILIIILFALGLGLFDLIYKVASSPEPLFNKEKLASMFSSITIKQEDKASNEEQEKAPEIEEEASSQIDMELEAQNQKEESLVGLKFVDKETILDEDKYIKTLDKLKENGARGIIFDIKDINGKLPFKPSHEEHKLFGLIAESKIDLFYANAVAYGYGELDLGKTIKLAKDRGLECYAREFAFRDSVVPYQVNQCAVMFQNTGLIWLDAQAEQGGKPWLNPYSKMAEDYVLAVGERALSLGADGLILEDACFPARSENSANYGNVFMPKSELLAFFGNRAVELEKKTNKPIYAVIKASEILDSKGQIYGEDALALANLHVAIDLDLESLPNSFELSPGETAGALRAENALTEKAFGKILEENKLKGKEDIIAVVRLGEDSRREAMRELLGKEVIALP